MESRVFLFVRKTGIQNTNIIEIDRKKAIKFIKDNYRNKNRYQIGILTGNNYETIKSVYGEYAPFKKVVELEILNSLVNNCWK